ncbi:MAG: FAD-dependent oxidoreductase [Pseudomonadota bacterium]
MTGPSFPHLFSPLTLGGVTLKNRILSSGHDTCMAADYKPSPAMIAYHKARAKGGAGLIVTQVAGVHETARYTSHALDATDDDCIPAYRELAAVCHAEGCAVFSQLFHPGREIMETSDGSLALAYAPSVSPSERFNVIPKALSAAMIAEIVAGYGAAARRMAAAGLDGVEIVASHGYLPAQFLNPFVNRREDAYGGSPEARRRFLEEIFAAVRAETPAGFVLGLRISGDEKDAEGLEEAEALTALRALAPQLDYVSVVAGTSASLGGAVHIVPPMAVANGYLAPFAALVKAAVDCPVMVTGRINQPHEAEQIIAGGQADLCGMTRAMICDPQMANKAAAGLTDDIRACIGCNQACIGHFHKGMPVSCIQFPETGRELTYGTRQPAAAPKSVLVVGGGPAGMKAAAVAAERGHKVVLHEAGARLGGQVLLAQLLPDRSEFGGLVTNLTREMELAGVEVRLKSQVDRTLLEAEAPDAVILATGGQPRWPEVEGQESGHLVDAWQILRGEANVGSSVVIADWRGDWIGLGLAERLARDGCQVRLAVTGLHPGHGVPNYVRDLAVASLSKLGVTFIPYTRLFGVDGDTVYFQHIASGEALIEEGVDTLVLAQGNVPDNRLAESLPNWQGELYEIGDCLSPRTAEEAVLDGLKVASRL